MLFFHSAGAARAAAQINSQETAVSGSDEHCSRNTRGVAIPVNGRCVGMAQFTANAHILIVKWPVRARENVM